MNKNLIEMEDLVVVELDNVKYALSTAEVDCLLDGYCITRDKQGIDVVLNQVDYQHCGNDGIIAACVGGLIYQKRSIEEHINKLELLSEIDERLIIVINMFNEFIKHKSVI